VGERPAGAAPNIVLILTDDQTWTELDQMPTVQSELVAKGTTFSNAFVTNPLCCPSRSTILTGKYSHGTDIYDNVAPHGGFQTFLQRGEENSTIARWLHDGGYRTGLVGKYLNGYEGSHIAHVPPGWDTWRAEVIGDGTTGGYYNYDVSENGTPVHFGTSAKDYSTDVLAGFATQFIESVPPSKPLFLYFAPHAPHKPATPPQRYQNAVKNLPAYRPSNYNESDLSAEPKWVQALPKLSSKDQKALDQFRINQYRTLLAVDDAVADILGSLDSTGRLSNTFIVFTSDNGLELGSHRWSFKEVPWEEAIRVPMVVRYDPLTGGVASTDPKLVLNLDLAPTMADVGGVAAPAVEGASFLGLLKNDPPAWRSDFLIEHWANNSAAPPYCAVREDQYKYVEYQDHEEQLYDLAADPYELHNLADDSRYAQTRERMHGRMVELCVPPPPGFSP
jgi:N-acetylglucosamine-6-sulfatase